MNAARTSTHHRRLSIALATAALVIVALLAAVPAAFAAPNTPNIPNDSGVRIAANGSEIVRAGGDVYVPAGQTVDSVTVFGGDAVIAGTVRHSVVAIGGDVRLRNTARVGVDMRADDAAVIAIGGTTTVAPGAVVTGTTGAFEDVTAGDALVAASVAFVGVTVAAATMIFLGVVGMVATVIFIAALVWLFVWLIRRDNRKARERTAQTQAQAPYDDGGYTAPAYVSAAAADGTAATVPMTGYATPATA